jgi:integrase
MSLRVNAFVEAMATQRIVRPSQITDEALATWASERMDTGVTNGTINRTLVVARVMLRWAARRTPPLCRLTALETRKNLKEIERGPRPIIPSPDEWKRLVVALLDAPPDTTWATWQREQHAVNSRGAAVLVAVAVQTGLRLDELRHVRPEDVLKASVTVAAHTGWSPKSWQERTVPVPETTADLAREFVTWRDCARGVRGKDLALSDGWIADKIDEAWLRAKLPGTAPRMHDCRRTFATELSRRGEPLTVVRDRLGHRDVQTTERYLGEYRTDAARVVPDLGLAGALATPTATVVSISRGRG